MAGEPEARGKTPPWSSLERRWFAVFLVAIAASLPFTVHPWYDSTYGDAATYVDTARSLANGEGYTHLERPFSIRPPGFSLILAPIVFSFGTNFLAINWTVSLLGAVGVVLLFGLTRGRLGWPLAMGVAAAVWLNPAYRSLCSQAMADVPGLTFTLGALVVASWADDDPSWRRELALGLLIAAAGYVRSAGLLLLPAIVISRLWRRFGATQPAPPWRSVVLRAALLTLVVVLCMLPWTLRNRSVASPFPADQTMAYSYSTGMWHQDPGDPSSPRLGLGAILERVPANGRKIASFAGSRLADGELSRSSAAWALLALVGLGAMLLKHRAPAELFVLGLLATLLVYYDFRDRLLLPVYVLGLAAWVELLRDLVGRRASAAIATLSVLVIVGTLTWNDLALRQHWPRVQALHESLFRRCQAIEAEIEQNARLATAFNWHYGVCLDRPVFSLLFATRRSGWLGTAESVIDKYDVDTVVLSPSNPVDAQLLRYFTPRYQELSRRSGLVFVRVRP